MQKTPEFLKMHQDFIETQTKFAAYRINNMNIIALPDVYHPRPGSSSFFMLDPIKEIYKALKNKKKRLLDVGCGTGVVGLSLGEYVEELHFSDITFNAVLCTQLNTLINFRKAKVYRSDLFDSLPQILFDVILFNIPLLDQKIERPAEISTNDPGGNIFLRFIQQSSQFLAPQGEIFFNYSTLGDMALINRIPSIFKIEKIQNFKDKFSSIEKYLFRLTIDPRFSRLEKEKNNSLTLLR